jgi:hypothetical protein
MDLGRTIQFLVNDVVRGSVPVELTGLAVLTFIVPPGPIRNALSDLNSCEATFTDEGEILCRVETGGGDSMGLRYEP